MSPTYTYRCQHGHEVYAHRPMDRRHLAPTGVCPDGPDKGETFCRYEFVFSETAPPVVKGGTPRHHGE